jgi:hypothetical protein
VDYTLTEVLVVLVSVSLLVAVVLPAVLLPFLVQFKDALLKSNVVLLFLNVSLKPGVLLNGEASVFLLPVPEN